MGITISGEAAKQFRELVEGDHLYYIDPKKPTEINFLPIKGVTEFPRKKGYVLVEYYQSSDAFQLTTSMESIPTRKILADGRATSIIAMSIPPSVYFTNKRALEKFMAGK